ncbi:EcsC family protein [Arthrobacter sp. BF1]|uniref:EcsC family protein n=1 Tax=Arthrobacter sp. BF1 TaxID=2821145 RepID=UPI001C4E7683|nr:EcsC family protein [Arthrobacter sp. BF1]
MSNDAAVLVEGIDRMSQYEEQVWEALNVYWLRRNNRRGLPNWASTALSRTGEVAGKAAERVLDVVPEVVVEPIRRAGGAVANKAARPAIDAATGILELVNDWAMELNDPKSVEKLARKQGLEIDSFADLQGQDLRTCDRLLALNTLTWRTAGALEGGGMGLLAMVPVAGLPVAITADIVAIQVLSTAIASRIAYSYGYDPKDPAEQLFIQRMVRRSFMAQAAKAKPLHGTARAANAVRGRVRWSAKLRQDHRLLAALEKLMQQASASGSRVSVQNVAKAVPFVGVLIGAGMNAAVLGNIAADAKRYCQTRFLCDKYGLPLPEALLFDREDEDDVTAHE